MQAEHLEKLLEPLGKHVRSYYGNQGGGTLPKDTSVAVCTIEKANSLINRLLEEGRLSEMGIIVIDELHMVSSVFTFVVNCHEFYYMLFVPAFLYFIIMKYER
jgi:replicative superfamily II helicase